MSRHYRAHWVMLIMSVMLESPARGQSAYCSMLGNFQAISDVRDFTFSIPAISNASFRTWSSSGGTNAAGQVVSPGGIDSILGLFTGGGGLLGTNDNISGLNLDSLINQPALVAGSYRIHLSVGAGGRGDGHWAADLVNNSGSLTTTGITGDSFFTGVAIGATGGAKSIFNASTFVFGPVDVNANGIVNISSSFGLNQELTVRSGGLINLLPGGTLNSQTFTQITGGGFNQTGGVATFSGVGLEVSSNGTALITSQVRFDNNTSLNILSGGSATFTSPLSVGIASSASLLVSGTNSRLIAPNNSTWGGNTGVASIVFTAGGVGTVSGAVQLGNSARVLISSGGRLTANSMSVGSGAMVTVSSGGSLLVSAGVDSAGTINLADGTLAGAITGTASSTLNSTGSSSLAAGAIKASKVNRLTIAGALDLNDNDLIVGSGTSLSQVVAHIRSARNGGAWNGAGLTSSFARNRPNHITGLAAISGAQFTSAGGAGIFSGQTYLPGDTLVKYTYNGDTDLNGVINFDDYARIDSGFNNQGAGGSVDWFHGDFDHNGAVNFDDYALIDLAFNAQSGSLREWMRALDGGDRSDRDTDARSLRIMQSHLARFGKPYSALLLTAVPEPGSMITVLFISASIARRGRRGNRLANVR
ncbi:hypothetical protein BH09PLA1_BH09PLA1_03330 [soil metagenome]